MAQKPDPKKFATIGKLKEIIAKNNKDKDNIEQRRKAYGTDLSVMSPEDAKDQIRLDQIESQNFRYGNLIKKADKEADAKAKNVKKVPAQRALDIADSLTVSASRKEGSAQSLSKYGFNVKDRLKSAKADETKANLIFDRLNKAGSNLESYYRTLYNNRYYNSKYIEKNKK